MKTIEEIDNKINELRKKRLDYQTNPDFVVVAALMIVQIDDEIKLLEWVKS